MARPQEANVGQRQVINTIEDTSKYQTGDSRRLRVIADPLRISETPQTSQLTALTEALGSVKPELMNWAVNREAEAYKKTIEIGKQKAQMGGVAQGEMEQFGYDNVKAVNDWTDWNQQVIQEYEQSFDKENGDLEAFMKAKWESNPFADKSENYVNKFTPLAGKTMEKLRASHGQFKAELQETRNGAELTRMFKADIKDVMGAGIEYGVGQYEARRDNLKAMFPGKTNSQLDELAYMAVLTSAEETGDTSLFKVFKQPHSDKTPGLYEMPKWKDKIDSDVRSIISAKVAARSKSDTENREALKVAADTKEREIIFDLIDVNNIEDVTKRAERLREITAKAKGYSDAGIPLSEGTLGKLLTNYSSLDKKQETKYQAQNYVNLRVGNPSVQQIYKAFNEDDISRTGFESLMSKHEAAQRRAESGGEGKEKPVANDAFVKQTFKEIDAITGYSPYNMTPDGEEARKNSSAVKAKVLDRIEDLVASGMSIKEAAAEGAVIGVQMVKEAGLQSKAFQEANKKIDAVEAKKKDPVSYYKSNPQDFTTDLRNNSLPKIPQKDLVVIQRDAKAHAEAAKKLKHHGSTK